MAGEPQAGSNPFIGMDCTNLGIVDLDGVPSGLILERTFPFILNTTFVLSGTFANFIASLGAAYQIRYYVDQIGGPVNTLLATRNGNTVGGQLVYGPANTQVTIPPNTLNAGTYKLTVVVSFNGAPPMTGFAEGPVVEVF